MQKDDEIIQLMQQIEGARKHQKLTILQLSKQADITYQYYHKCLKGESIPSIPVLRMLASGVNLVFEVRLRFELGFFE